MSPDEPARGRWAAPALLLAAGLVAAFHPALLSGFADLQINHGDPRLVNYVLEHSWLWVSGADLHASFWDPPVYYPAPNGSALSDVMLGTGPLYWLPRALGAGPGLAMQLWMTACLALDFLAAHLFLRRIAGCAPWPAAVGAFLFGFGSSRLANFNSPQLFPLFWGVLALLALGRALEAARDADPRKGAGWLAGFFAFLSLQTWSAFYPAFFFALVLLVAALIGLAVRAGRERLLGLVRRHAVALPALALLAAASVWPLADAHLAVARETGMRPWVEVRAGLPVVGSWFFQGEDSVLYGWLASAAPFRFDSPPSQHSNGVGALTLVLAALGLAGAWRRPLARVALGTTLVLVALTLRLPGDFTAWRWAYELVPGAGAIRYLARLGILLALPAALGVAWLLDRPGWRSRPLLAAALAAACLAEQLHVLDARDDAAYAEAVARVAAEVEPGREAFFLTTTGDPYRGNLAQIRRRQTHVLAMWAASAAGVPTVNGFYGLDPAGWRMVDPNPRDAQHAERLGRNLAAWLQAEAVDPSRVQLVSVPEAWMPWGGR